jgi:hypothetical protein
MFDWLPDPERSELDACLRKYGPTSLTRVATLVEGGALKKPLQNAKRIVPDLSDKPWLELRGDLLAFATALEAAHPIIKKEVEARVQTFERLEPYGGKKNSVMGWNALYIYRAGKLEIENERAFQSTLGIITPHLHNLYALGEIFFSILEPGTEIPSHCDPGNFWVPLHLGVTIPTNCSLTVATETRPWVEGKCSLFDASFEHNGRNGSTHRRIVLIAEVWHPDLTPAERTAITIVFRFFFTALGSAD